MLLEEVAEKERTSVTLGEKQRRTDVNLQLCRAELYSDKKSALKTVKKLERRLLSMQGMIAHLVEENKRKQAIIEELECAFTLQHELPQGGVHHRIQEEHLACKCVPVACIQAILKYR